MRFLILNTDYPEFISWLYTQNPGLQRLSFEEQMEVRARSLFGVADFYSANLIRLGHEAWDIHANNEFIQKAWAREHNLRPDRWTDALRRLNAASNLEGDRSGEVRIGAFRSLLNQSVQLLTNHQSWLYRILEAQIRYYRPDILFNHDIGLSSRFFQRVKPFYKLLVGQHAAPLPLGHDLTVYDLILSSLPNVVRNFRQHGIHSELFRLGFEPAVLDAVEETERSVQVSFVGSLSEFHTSRRRWLEDICQGGDVKVWGSEANGLPRDSTLRESYQGPAWGLDMYRVLRSSLITLNHHIDMASDHANNMRLYESTGVGTFLVTDGMETLHKMFEPGKEVATYRNSQDCLEVVRYFLENEDERDKIAQAGQRRTLREHTYHHRMRELIQIVSRYLSSGLESEDEDH